MMAEPMGVTRRNLSRWAARQQKAATTPARLGRPEVIPTEARWKIRECYASHYKQWGPRVLSIWARRQGIGSWSPSTIARVIADMREKPEPKPKPRRYEVVAPFVMWSEDGAGFWERKRKKELVVLQDEYSRYKLNHRLVPGPADADDVCEYLKQAFDKYGAPLVLKHDGGSIFHDDKVKKLLERYGVVPLTSPPRYPPYNGKKERSVRDIKSYERAMRKQEPDISLGERIVASLYDLNIDRPRPVLGGRTARELFENDRIALPDRDRFRKEVEVQTRINRRHARSRHEQRRARRRAIEEVLSRYGLLVDKADVSTYLRAKGASL
jgi:transposase InsO family protein